MTKREWIKQRIEELIEEGHDPEAAHAIAVFEFFDKFGNVDEVPDVGDNK